MIAKGCRVDLAIGSRHRETTQKPTKNSIVFRRGEKKARAFGARMGARLGGRKTRGSVLAEFLACRTRTPACRRNIKRGIPNGLMPLMRNSPRVVIKSRIGQAGEPLVTGAGWPKALCKAQAGYTAPAHGVTGAIVCRDAPCNTGDVNRNGKNGTAPGTGL